MPVYRNISGTWRQARVWRNIAGTWRSGVLWRNIAGVWKVVSGQLAASISPNPLDVESSSSPISGAATASASGGSGSYSYAWAYVSGTPMSLGSTNTASTTFTAVVPLGSSRSAVYSCTITDTLTGNSTTAFVSITFTHS